MTKYTGKRPRYGSDLLTRLAWYSRPGPDGCIDWIGANRGTKAPYGMLNWRSRYTSVHILSWELYNETTVPRGLVVRHTCDRHQCLNPQHLEIGTTADNMADREARGRGRQPKGEASGRSKLTESQVLAIRASTTSQSVTAKAYGVTKPLIRYIRQRKIWRHI